MAKSDSPTPKKKKKKAGAKAKQRGAPRPRTKLRPGAPPVVGVVVAAPGDLAGIGKVVAALDELEVPCDVRVLSPHRTPERTAAYARAARQNGLQVLIACAGTGAHLAGMLAAHTTLPVIGVPLANGALQGVDALLATVQMPSGVPVATVGIDGARNAAFLAARILAGTHPELRDRLDAHREAALDRYDDADMSRPGQMRRTKKMW